MYTVQTQLLFITYTQLHVLATAWNMSVKENGVVYDSW